MPLAAPGPVGVFDSGLGGLSILRALRAELPHEDMVYVADSGYAPYGERGHAFVAARSRRIVAYLRGRHRIKALVIACNTATAAAAHLLRQEFPGLPIIGVEPALKPAASASRTGRIGVIGTKGTLGSPKFQALLGSLAGRAEFVVQPCAGLAQAIETGNTARVEALWTRYAALMGRFGHVAGDIDTLVLGCTHYPLASQALRKSLSSGIRLLETGPPVARQTARVLTQAQCQRHQPHGRTAAVRLYTTGSPAALASAATRWLGLPSPVRACALRWG